MPEQITIVIPQVTSATDALLASLVSSLDNYVLFVSWYLSSALGRCAPLADVYTTVVVTLCQETVDPYNWAWAALGLMLLAAVPMVGSAMALSSLYRWVGIRSQLF